jgi:ribosomal protein S18 acetylase RimI-like enzyme
MISVIRATERDYTPIVSIGKASVEESHRGSSPDEVMHEFLERNYNDDAIKEELNDVNNIYHIIQFNNSPAGFSKIVLNAKHPNIIEENVAKLDRIYLSKDFYGLKLGLELLNFNIELSKANGQSGMWLYTWIGNQRAIDFYLKAGFIIIGSHQYYVTETHYDVSHQMFLKFS